MHALAAILTTALLATSAFADNIRETYTARLSARDHFNSSGERLTSAAAIIRQDRANFHKFGKRDAEDEADSFFASAHNRELLEKLLERGSAKKAAILAIINGTPLIRVEVCTDARTGGDYIRVSLIDN